MSAAEPQKLSHNINYRYRQNPGMLYLSGCQEPSSVFVLEKPQKGREEEQGEGAIDTTEGRYQSRGYRSRIYLPARDPQKELWDGPLTGPERARWMFGTDVAYPVEQLQIHLPHLLQKHSHVYLAENSPLRPTIAALSSELNLQAQLQIHNISGLLDMQRVFKTPAELEILKKGAEITSAGFDSVFRKTKPGMMEYQLYALFEYEVKSRGCQRLAYPPVVASGANANILHYVSYDMPLREGELLLLDAGGEYHGYATDVTRTYPVSGKFSAAQKLLYEHVLQVQERCIAAATADSGNTISRLQKMAVIGLTEALIELGIIKESLQEALARHAIQPFYPHNIGHYLGMDTHDTPSVSTMSSLKPGMLITVEPGLYIPDIPSVPKEFRNIGIRIEDNIFIDETSNQVLTASIPKSVQELEAIVGSSA